MKIGLSVLGALLTSILSAHDGIIWAQMASQGSISSRQGVGKDWMNVTMANPNMISSKLFASCLAASRTVEMTPFSIETEQGVEFQRYTPDWLYPLVNWQRAEGAGTILDCADAATKAGESCFMFNFDDTGCKLLFNVTYDLSVQPTCSEVEREAVYIRTTASSNCFLPAIELATYSRGYWCAQVVQQTISSPQQNSKELCNATSEYATNAAFGDNPGNVTGLTYQTSLETIQKTLGLMGYKVDVSVMMKWNVYSKIPGWTWFGDRFSLPLPVAAFAAGIANGGTGAADFQVLFMKADDGFRLHPAKADVVLPAVLCMYGMEPGLVGKVPRKSKT